MGNRQLNRLSVRAVETKKLPGLFCDGGGLYLQIATGGAKTWIFRYRSPITKKLRYMGLGSLRAVGLVEARARATAQRNLLSQGLDPIQARDEVAKQKAQSAAKSISFAECAENYIRSHRVGWKNKKHGEQWTSTIETYCNPVFGKVPVQDVDTELVLKALEPIWSRIPESASRLRGRIEVILDWAKARGYRQGENPARWKGHLKQLLPTLARKNRVRHYPALPYEQIGDFMALLRSQNSIGALALEFTILTAARSNEVFGATASEFDLEKGFWTVSADRMKAGREHKVPLSPRSLEIARKMLELKADYLFPGRRQGTRLSPMTMTAVLKRMGHNDITVHGFRSTFRDWAAEQTNFAREVCEMALAHTILNKVEAAYRRGDLLEKRRKMMDTWAEFISGPSAKAQAIPIRRVA